MSSSMATKPKNPTVLLAISSITSQMQTIAKSSWRLLLSVYFSPQHTLIQAILNSQLHSCCGHQTGLPASYSFLTPIFHSSLGNQRDLFEIKPLPLPPVALKISQNCNVVYKSLCSLVPAYLSNRFLHHLPFARLYLHLPSPAQPLPCSS